MRRFYFSDSVSLCTKCSRKAAECGDSILATAYPYARSAAAKRRGA
ncbi:MAG: hypothetical protein LBH47_01220 [Christensenellaceae bacterium]|nr:hypothetical protein [Christensenellaceae bacterium]